MNNDRLILRKNQLERLKRDMQNKKIAYFGTHTGWGKTTLVLQYLQENNLRYEYISAKRSDWFSLFKQAIYKREKYIVLDDMQLIRENGDSLAGYIADSFSSKFYLIGRSRLPSYLKAFYITKQLMVYDNCFFSLKTEEFWELARLSGKQLTKSLAEEILQFTEGWILGTIFVLEHLDSQGMTEEFKNIAYEDIFGYFDNMIFHTFDAELQKFLLCTAHLSTFTEKHAQMLCGHNDIGHHLEEALRIGSFLSFTPPDFYSFHPLFHRYLMWKQKKVLHTEDLNRCYEISALYYMLEDNLPMALAFYSLADNQQKISELLIKNADKHAGNGYFYETSQYYLSLPEQLVQQSTELMSALCMIYSLRCKTEESEYYFNLLAEFEKQLSKKDPRKKDAQQRLAYLTIALPHRGIVNLIDIFKKVSALIHSNTLHLQTMSITGNMPSMMNGGKDFCEWSKKDVFLYKTMKNAMYTVLGKSSHGFAEIGLGESLFEKNTDGNFTEELTLLNIGFYEAQISGNIQLQFAALAVMARIYVTQGKLQNAIQTFEKFRFTIDSASDIARNIDAFSAYLHMLAGDAEYVDRWFEKEAPDEYQCFYITERYRYLIKIKIYLIKKMYSEALSLLSRVDQYFMDYARVYCHMEAMILKAIILYRSKDPTWRQVFNDALNLCEEYKFVRIISKFGVAVLNMLKNTMAGGNANYLEILLENTKKQAVLYPKYLRAETKIDYNLTETERSVLKLVSDGLTNNEIAELMDISIRTVKFHLTNIYAKLEVKNRSSAIRIAGEIDLL